MINGYMISIGAFQVFGRKIFSNAREMHRMPNIQTGLTLDDHGIVKDTVVSK